MRLEDQNALRRGDTQRIHHDHLALGVLFQKLLAGGIDVVDGAGKLAGERHKQDVLARLEYGFEDLQIGAQRQERGTRRCACAHIVKVLLLFSAAAQIVHVLFAIHNVGHVHHAQVQFIYIAKRQIGIGIGHKYVGIHAISSLRAGSYGPNE